MSALKPEQILPFHSRGEIGRVISEFLAHQRLRARHGKINERSLDKLVHYLNRFSVDYGSRSLAECSKNQIEKWLLAHPEWQAPHTLLDAVGSVMACFNWAQEEDLIVKNQFRRPKDLPEPGPRQAIRKSEYRAMMLLARRCNGIDRRKMPTSGPFRLGLWFLWRTGARPGEMRGSQWDDLDWQTGAIELYEHKTARKTGQSRLLILDRWVLRILAKLYPRRRPGSTHIFLNSRGRPWTKDFQKRFRRYADMAGVRKEVSTYCLRHGVCVDLIEHGASDRQAADYLGHKTTRYVSWYGRSTRRKRDHLRRIGEMRRTKLEE